MKFSLKVVIVSWTTPRYVFNINFIFIFVKIALKHLSGARLCILYNYIVVQNSLSGFVSNV